MNEGNGTGFSYTGDRFAKEKQEYEKLVSDINSDIDGNILPLLEALKKEWIHPGISDDYIKQLIDAIENIKESEREVLRTAYQNFDAIHNAIMTGISKEI